MGALKKHGIISKNSQSDTVKIFEGLFPGKSFIDIDYNTPKDYVTKYWSKYKEQYPKKSASLNGKFFELIIYTLLFREGIRPFYTQAKIAFVPNIQYDTILFNNSQPISLSLKTSLRERYKQADLEAIALKYVHRKAKSYLLTLEQDEAIKVANKISEGAVIGIDAVIDCSTEEINILIEELKRIDFIESVKIDVVTGFLIR